MVASPSRLRTAAVIAAGALLLHELRFMVAPHAETDAAGHAYLPLAGLAVALCVAGACAHLVALATGARRPEEPEPALGASRAWALGTVAVLAVFVAQELAEAALAGNRTGGIDAIVGAGGWVALPLGVGVGGVVALALSGARAVERAAALGRAGRHAERAGTPGRVGRRRGHRRSRPALAAHLSGRAPPAIS